MRNDKIIDLHINGKFSFREIANNYHITKNKVAGVIWRYNNPKMWTKKISAKNRRKYYDSLGKEVPL